MAPDPGTVVHISDGQLLLESRQREHPCFDNIPALMYVLDRSGHFVVWNRACEETFGWKVQELNACDDPLTLLYPETATRARVRETVRPDSIFHEYCTRTKDGSERKTLWAAFDLPDGTVAHLGQDVTECRRRQEELHEHHQILSSVFNSAPIGMFCLDRCGRVTIWSRASERMFGWKSHEVLGQPNPIVPPEKMDEFAAIHEHVLADNSVNSKEVVRQRRDGSLIHILLSVSPVHDEQGRIIGATGMCMDITARKQAEQALQESEEKFRRVVETANEGIWIFDSELRTTFVNRRMAAMLGRDEAEMHGHLMSDFLFPEDLPACRRKMQEQEKGFSDCEELRFQHKNGDAVWALVSATPMYDAGGTFVGSFGMCTDITERRKTEEERMKLEQQLLQSQKMEAIGTLAGGIAHDFNNILAGIVGFTQIAQDALPKDSPAQFCLTETQKLSDRATDLVRQIVSFSRKNLLEPQPVPVYSITRDVLKLLRASIPATIEIRQSIDQRSGMVMADATQIHQIIMNLCTNAAHAMEGKRGVLSVEVASVFVTTTDVAKYPGIRSGPYVKLTVSDTGPGIDPEVAGKIFDPFYTTKAPGKGTGIGLSIVHGIVKRLKGTITFESVPEQGATFQVLLPRIQAELDTHVEPARPLPGGTARILFVDDEAALSGITEMMLRPLGYRVTAVQNSQEALALFQNAPKDFDLVITDLTMPHLTGDELALKIMQIRPEVPVILCTGYPEAARKKRGPNVRAVLTKPVKKKILAETVRDVLHRAVPGDHTRC